MKPAASTRPGGPETGAHQARGSWSQGAWRWWAAAAAVLALAVALQPALLVRFTRDNAFHPDTSLALTFLRVFLVVLAPIVALWGELANTRRRGVLFGLLVLAALAPRAVRLDSPYLDQHSHRQADVAQIARNYYEKNANILYPEVNWYADVPNTIESTFTLVPWLAHLGYRVLGEQPWVGRGLVMLFSVLGVVSTFGLVSLYWGQVAGFLAALFLAISPMAVYFGRAFMDDAPSLALSIAALWGIAEWTKRGRRWGLLLGIPALALALMVKVVTLYVYFPVAVILWERWRWGTWRQPAAWAILGLPLIPTIAWYAWARSLGQQYLTFGIGGPASNESNAKWGSLGEILSLDFGRKIGMRIYRQILTPVGLAMVLLGVLRLIFSWGVHLESASERYLDHEKTKVTKSAKREGGHFPSRSLQISSFASLASFVSSWSRLRGPGRGSHGNAVAKDDLRPGGVVFVAWLAGTLLFTLISGAAQLIHNYYQLPFAASLAPFAGLGVATVWGWRSAGKLLAMGLLLLLAVSSARALPAYYNGEWKGSIPHESAVVQGMTAPGDPVITVVWDNDPTLSYHLHRSTWIVNYLDPAALDRVPEYLARGARVLVLQDLDRPRAGVLWELPWLPALALVERGEDYAIYRVP